MKKAPNLKQQPADRFTEQVIFAGADAWVHAKDWQHNNRAGDTVPPVVLAGRELDNLHNLHNLSITDNGRRFVRVCRAGPLSERHITTIATRLALANVREARFYSESHELLEDWTPRLAGLKAEAERGESSVVPAVMACLADGADLAHMAACERGKVLVAYYEQVAVNPDSGTVYQYQEGIWQHQPDTLLKRTLAAIFEAHETPYNPKGIEAAIESMRIMVPVLPTSGRAQVAFVNGVYDLNAGQFQPHSPDNGLLHHNGIIWTEATPGESLKDHAPHFTAG